MVSNKQYTQLGAIALLVMALAALGMWSGWQPFEVGQGTEPPVVTGTGICPTGTGMANVLHKTSYLDTSTGDDTQMNTSVALYLQGAKTATSSGTTGTSGYTEVGEVNCGAVLTGFYGDGGTAYYYQKVDTSATNAANVYMDAKPKRASNVTVTFSNTTHFGVTSYSGVVMGSGASNTDATVKVKAGAYYFGDRSFEICALFYTTNITKVSFGASATEIAADSSMSVTTGMQIKCYEVAQQLYNYNSVELPVVIQAKASVTPSDSNISIWVNDKSAYLKDGALVGGFFNADTLADLGLVRAGHAQAVTANEV